MFPVVGPEVFRTIPRKVFHGSSRDSETFGQPARCWHYRCGWLIRRKRYIWQVAALKLLRLSKKQRQWLNDLNSDFALRRCAGFAVFFLPLPEPGKAGLRLHLAKPSEPPENRNRFPLRSAPKRL